MSANRLLFSTMVVLVVATAAFLWVAGADPEVMQLIAGFLALAAVVGLLEQLDRRSSWLPGPTHRDPDDPNGHFYKWYGDGR